VTVFVDSNVLIRHLTGQPPDQAGRATSALRSAESLFLVDLVIAEVVFVLESVYELDRERVADLLRAVLGFPAIRVADAPLLLRTLEIYELHRIHFVEAYLAACAEASGTGAVMSFDRAINPVSTVRRLEPGA
jgi:predicted nucleic-acid-binding protein